MEATVANPHVLQHWYQKQVSRAGTSNYILQDLWDVITCRCPWYLLLVQHSSYGLNAMELLQPFDKPLICIRLCCQKQVPRVWISNQCTWKTFMIHQTFVWWALYIPFKIVKLLMRHLGLAIGNVRCVRWFSWTVSNYIPHLGQG